MKPIDVSQLVRRLCDGDDSAFHTLLEAENSIIPLLIQQFHAHVHGADRARIIEVIWQFRDKGTVPFLASALHDPHSEVWKLALDGLVAIGGIDSRDAVAKFCSDVSEDSERAQWALEAMRQIQL